MIIKISLLCKKGVCFMIAALLIFGINISRVMTSDCDYFSKAISFMGTELKSEYENVSDCCSFKGVTCNNNHITSIVFTNFKDSTIDLNKFIENLKNLEYLDTLELTNIISNSKKRLPATLGSIKSLKTLKFNNNIEDYADSGIPSELGNLINLEILELKNNGLSGVMPFDFKNLQKLKTLYIDRNEKITGYVPLLSNLKYCTYSETGLCYLPGASCKSLASPCTTEKIKATNKINGSPYPNTDKFEKAKSTNSDPKNKFSFIAFLIIFILLFCCCCHSNEKSHNKKQKSHNKKQKTHDEKKKTQTFKVIDTCNINTSNTHSIADLSNEYVSLGANRVTATSFLQPDNQSANSISFSQPTNQQINKSENQPENQLVNQIENKPVN